MISVSSRVCLTACGVLAGNCHSATDLFEALCDDRPVCGGISNSQALAGAAGLDAGDAAILSRHQILALSVVEQAWKSAGLPPERNRLRGEREKHRLPRFGCVSGSSLGGLVAMEEDMAASGKFSPYSITRWRGNAVSAVVTVRYGLGGADFSLNAASATGAQILHLAASLIDSGMLDVVVAVAADAALSPALKSAMGRGGSVTRDSGSGPLSAERSGMLPAEGAACVVLESASHAAQRGAAPVAEWLGGGCANESRHLMAPDPEARVLGDLLAAAKNQTAHKPVDWISLHATGTPRFDAAEMACIRRVFGERLPWISAMKRTTGHALAASGLLEASLLAEGMRSRKLPAWPGNMDPAFGLPQKPPLPAKPPEIALQIGQGMGGTVVVNLLGRA
ncbi:MAG: beta-ketoacyl synthase N-terminal-like domain-containing protein [bacterium]